MNSDAAMRAANALLGGNGGRSVLLRMPAPAVAGAAGEELGLATPEFQDVARVLGSLAFNAADAMFAAALGIVVDDVVFAITGCVASQSDGAAYCYCVGLAKPVW